jgi:exodeoxyribonuclease VII large subunit
MNLVSTMGQQLAFQRTSLKRAMATRLDYMQATLSVLEKRMADLSPLSILKRGYSITKKLPEKHLLRDTSGVEKGDQVQVLLAKGELTCRIEGLKN